MRSNTRLLVMLLSVLWFAFWPASPGICSPTYQVSEAQMLQLESILNGLEQDNERLQTLLSESKEELRMASSESETLKRALIEAQNHLTELQKQFQELRTESESARKSLEAANNELQMACESWKKSVKQHERTESRLRTQRNIWTVIACILGGVAATR